MIVKVTADDGTVGWGQSLPVESWSYETLEASTVAIRDYRHDGIFENFTRVMWVDGTWVCLETGLH